MIKILQQIQFLDRRCLMFVFFTFVQTISTGMPKLCVSVLSPSGRTTASSSPDVGARRGEDGAASSGSEYSWKAFTT